MNRKSYNIKAMIEASILTSIFIVITLISNLLGIGFLGYYDFLVPVFFAVIYIKTGWKYSSLSVIASSIVLLFILGNPISSIMVIQGAILGISTGFILSRFDCIGDEIIFVSIISLFTLFIFDFILRTFTNISIVSNFSEFSKDMSQIIDKSISMINSNGGNDKAISILENYRAMIGSNMIKQTFYFVFGLTSVGSGIIVYFLTLISVKKLKISIPGHSYKLNMIGSMKKNIRFVLSSRKMFIIMIVYVLFAEILKFIKFKTGIEYIDGIIFSLEYIFTIFTFKDSIVITENKMISESGSIRSVRWYRVFMVVALLFNVKLMYIVAVVNYMINDKDGKYRSLFRKALKRNLE